MTTTASTGYTTTAQAATAYANLKRVGAVMVTDDQRADTLTAIAAADGLTLTRNTAHGITSLALAHVCRDLAPAGGPSVDAAYCLACLARNA